MPSIIVMSKCDVIYKDAPPQMWASVTKLIKMSFFEALLKSQTHTHPHTSGTGYKPKKILNTILA